MSIVQTVYPNYHDALVEGQIADTTTCDIDSWRLTGTGASVEFGLAVSRSGVATAGDRDAVAYAGARFAGIAVMDERLKASSDAEFQEGDLMPLAWRGDIAVRVAAAVSVGDDVVIATANVPATPEVIGQLSSVTADSTHILLAGARFIRAAVAGGISVVRLTGPAPV